MKRDIIEQAKQIIDLRRYHAENDARNNKIKALEDNTFKSLYQSYITKMIDASKNGKELSESDRKIKEKYLKRLKELNIPSIEPDYYCKKCSDSGFVNGKCCICLSNEINRILKRDSGFDFLESFDKVNFSIFNNKTYMEKLYNKMKEWCHSNFNKSLIYIAGNTGVGKTHLIKCMANELINSNHIVRFTTSFSMHQDFAKSYTTRDLDEKNNLLNKYLDVEALFIDDLGTEHSQYNITINYLYQVINERKIKRLPTIITSNLKLDEIKDYYDERISSRIIDKETSICVFIEGDDIRLKNIKK